MSPLSKFFALKFLNEIKNLAAESADEKFKVYQFPLLLLKVRADTNLGMVWDKSKAAAV
jgi:hypothetical protein